MIEPTKEQAEKAKEIIDSWIKNPGMAGEADLMTKIAQALADSQALKVMVDREAIRKLVQDIRKTDIDEDDTYYYPLSEEGAIRAILSLTGGSGEEDEEIQRLKQHIESTQGMAMVDVAGLLYDKDKAIQELHEALSWIDLSDYPEAKEVFNRYGRKP